MNKNVIFNRQNNQPREDTTGVLKVTALLYLKDALVKQQYEDCPELIASAKNFGASRSEIRAVITGYLRGNRADRPDGGKRRKAGRRF